MTDPIQRKWWGKNGLLDNPFRDPLQQELGYKINKRYTGCLLIAFATGVLVASVVAFLIYWLTRS